MGLNAGKGVEIRAQSPGSQGAQPAYRRNRRPVMKRLDTRGFASSPTPADTVAQSDRKLLVVALITLNLNPPFGNLGPGPRAVIASHWRTRRVIIWGTAVVRTWSTAHRCVCEAELGARTL